MLMAAPMMVGQLTLKGRMIRTKEEVAVHYVDVDHVDVDHVEVHRDGMHPNVVYRDETKVLLLHQEVKVLQEQLVQN